MGNYTYILNSIMEEGGRKRVKKNKRMMPKTKHLRILRSLIKYISIFSLLFILLLSYYQNYDSNKRFDQYFSLEYKEYGYSKGFKFNDDAKSSPIFYWQWDCAPTKDQEFYSCDHAPSIPFIGESKHYVFELYILSDQEIIDQEKLWDQRKKINDFIIRFSLLLMIGLIYFNRWEFKNDYEEWKKTPLAQIIKKLKKVD